jgi:hypothetical protein
MPEACFQHDRPRGAQFCAGHPLGHAPFLPDARKPRVSARIKRRDAGAVLGNRGAVSPAPGDLLRGLLGSRVSGSQDLTVRWLPSGTRVRRFLFPVRAYSSARSSLAGSSGGFSLAAADWTTPLLVLCSLRSNRASWTKPPNERPTFQAPIACHVGCWYRRPVAGRRRHEYAGAAGCGDKSAVKFFAHGELDKPASAP